MSAPDITLGYGQILVIQSVSGLGVSSTDNKTQFGTVQKVSDLCDSYIVGDSVMYDPTKGSSLVYGSTIYILINEENISGVEVIPP